MARAYNFSPGPSALPEPVLRQAQAEMLEYRDTGASIVEISHRGPYFLQVAQRTEAEASRKMVHRVRIPVNPPHCLEVARPCPADHPSLPPSTRPPARSTGASSSSAGLTRPPQRNRPTRPSQADVMSPRMSSTPKPWVSHTIV